LNKKMPVYIVEIDEEKGREIIVSRSHIGLIEGLLKREVPEVASGNVVIKKIVREPGSRAKIAVYSEQPGIDPVGSCVGQRGVRIQAVIDALDGLEKIDVIQWNSDDEKLILNSLSPAKDLTVEINEKEKLAKVSASREELPLVIGRDGQNVRLASKLTGYNIEVEGREEFEKEVEETETAKEEDIVPKEEQPDGAKEVEKEDVKESKVKIESKDKDSIQEENKDPQVLSQENDEQKEVEPEEKSSDVQEEKSDKE